MTFERVLESGIEDRGRRPYRAVARDYYFDEAPSEPRT